MLNSFIRVNKKIILKHYWKNLNMKLKKEKLENLINKDLDLSLSDNKIDNESDNECNNEFDNESNE